MELRRFFVSDSDIDGDSITVRGDEFRHMTKVLRLKKGFKAIVCANDGKERHCVIDRIEKDFATLTVERVDTGQKECISDSLLRGAEKPESGPGRAQGGGIRGGRHRSVCFRQHRGSQFHLAQSLALCVGL